MIVFARQHLARPLVLAAVLAVAILLSVVGIRAAAPDDPTCAPDNEQCVVADGIQRNADNPAETTRYMLTNESGAPNVFSQYFFDAAGAPVHTETLTVQASSSNSYYAEFRGIPRTYSGTLVVTATHDFTLQIVGPTALCPVPIDDSCLSIQLPVAATQYTIRNPNSRPLTTTHDVWQDGELLRSFADTIPAFSSRTYDAGSGQPTLAAAGGALAVVVRAPQPFVNAPPPTPTPEPTPTPTGGRVALPYLVR